MKLKQFLEDELVVRKGAIGIPQKGRIDQYRERYQKLVASGAKFTHTVYKISVGNRVVVHIKEPSESIPNFYYDVLLELEIGEFERDFGNCEVKFFSNCPSFVYQGLGYTLSHLDTNEPSGNKPKGKNQGQLIGFLSRKVPTSNMLVPGSESKIEGEPIENAPNIRNPSGIPFLDKSLYFAIFHLMDSTNPMAIRAGRRWRTESQVMSVVTDFNVLMARRAVAERRIKESKSRERRLQEESVRTTEKTIRRANSLQQPKKAQTARQIVSTAKTAKSMSKPRTMRSTGGNKS